MSWSWAAGAMSGIASAYAAREQSSLESRRRALEGLGHMFSGIDHLQSVAPGVVPPDLLQAYMSLSSNAGITHYRRGEGDIVFVCAYCDSPRIDRVKRCVSCGAREIKR